MFWSCLTVFAMLQAVVLGMDLTDLQCDEDLVEGYIIPDPVYCDRYLDCDPVTGRAVRLCTEGQGVDLGTGLCEDQSKVDCGSRQVLKDQVKPESIVRKVLTRGGSKLSSPVSPLSTTAVPTDPVPTHTSVHTIDPLAGLVCEKSETGYSVPDPVQCDRYAECSPHGVKTYKLCPDGLALSLERGECDFLVKTDCSDRPQLQPPKGHGPCIRENGKYPLPAHESCSKYVDCRAGEVHVQGCAVGVVFDQVLGCVHPDETNRPGCSANDQYEFQCPHFGLQQRFGDHDRLPHPTDCKLYYACLRNGLPRLNSCTKPQVFNPESGFCDDQDNVPGCEGYYVMEVKNDSIDREKITNEIREKLLKEFGLPSHSRVVRSAKIIEASSAKTVAFVPTASVRL